MNKTKNKSKWPERHQMHFLGTQQPQPVPIYLLDYDTCVGYRPRPFPVIPRVGERIDGEWVGKSEVMFEVIRIDHSLHSDYCKVPFITIYISELRDLKRPSWEDLKDELQRFLERSKMD